MKVRVASAGTGKTTSLVKRYIELLASGVSLRRIAGVTFTRNAADELRQRVRQGLYEVRDTQKFLHWPFTFAPETLQEALNELDGVTLSTINGFMAQCLRITAPHLTLDPDFQTMGEWQAEAIFEEELTSLFYLASDSEHSLHQAVMLVGSSGHKHLMTLFRQRSLSETFTVPELSDDDLSNPPELGHDTDDAEVDNTQPDAYLVTEALITLYEEIYKRYRIRLGAQLLPPPEVERRALDLMRHPQALERICQRYTVVLVDEFQDVNPLQGRFFAALEQAGITLEVVGDPKQSIYGFRNADVEMFRSALAQAKQEDILTPLTETFRHAKVVARFLNGLTSALAKKQMGFGLDEAPPVESAGKQAQRQGRLELHWVVGDEPVADLRAHEALLMAEQLQGLQALGYAYSDMAVLARAHAGLALMEQALSTLHIPYVMVQGRGYFDRLEVRDIYHALKVGVHAYGVSLAAWLRSPFVDMPLMEVDTTLQADDPLAYIETHHPEVLQRLEKTCQQVRSGPVTAVKFLVREPFIGGKRYIDFLDARQRENVDALLFTIAAEPPGDIEILLEKLELLSRQKEAGDVPQSGEGVKLLTVHRAKGLEWPVVALFDLGRQSYFPPADIVVEPDTGVVAFKGSEAFARIYKGAKARNDQEGYRLLYVAASRARDVLVMTGSVKQGRYGPKYEGWAQALKVMDLGAHAKPFDRPDFVMQTHAYQKTNLEEAPPVAPRVLEPSPWLHHTYELFPFSPVSSPTSLKIADNNPDESHEPLPFRDSGDGEYLPGRSRAIGTLVHYAISQNWFHDNPRHMDNLRYQEVMFAFELEEQDEILLEVGGHLERYHALMDTGALPPLALRDEDYPELPMALPEGNLVLQGIIDRLYRVGDRWVIEDYKTDKEIIPDNYAFQLAVYAQAIKRLKGVMPQTQLVYLRYKEIYPFEPAHLAEVFAQKMAKIESS